MRIIKKPFYWVSAHSNIDFTFEYENQFALTNILGNGGFAVFIFVSDGIHSLSVGDYIYCDTSPYVGYHKVTEILFSNWYKTETAFDLGNPVTSGTITFIQNRVFEIYKGGDIDEHEYLKIAAFKPEPNRQGQLVVNISGYINKIFDVINSNDTVAIGGNEVWYNLFNKIILFIDGVLHSEHMVLNSAITMFELNSNYVDTGRSLNGGSLGNHYFNCGDSKDIIIKDSLVITGNIYSDGVDVTDNPHFNPTDFDTPDFDTTG